MGGATGETPVAAESDSGEVTPTDEPPTTETPVAEETPLPQETTADPLITEEPLPTEPLAVEETPFSEESLPLDGELILADEAGDPLVMASEETAALLQGGDPYFMVGTQKYAWVFDTDGLPGWQTDCPAGTTPGTTCFQATGSHTIETVLDFIDANGLVPTDKKIYVEAGIYNEQVALGYTGIVIDGTSSIFLKQLVGLIGVDGSDETIINGNVTVRGTVGGFTLSGFTINGGVTFSSNLGSLTLNDLVVENANGTGVVVEGQSGSVTLTNIQSSDNLGAGLYLENTSSTTAYPVAITNSEFDDNGLGSEIYSKGSISINGVSASRNYGTGMYIETLGAVTIKNGVFSDNQFYDDNYLQDWGIGLNIHNQTTTAAVTLENIQANGNGDSGVWVTTIGAITAKTINASNNWGRGMFIAPHTIWTYPTTVSISDGVFNSNAAVGLQVEAKGNVTLSYVNASDNDWNGVYVDNCVWDGAKCSGTGTVTILNPYQAPMEFNWNGSAGIFSGLGIDSGGAVTMTGISASGNTGSGIEVNNRYPGKTGGVTFNVLPEILTTSQQSMFISNNDAGISIFSNGPVAVNGNLKFTIFVENNQAMGIRIGDSTYPTGSTVTIKGVDLVDNPVRSIVIYSKGTITLDSVWVNHELSDDHYTANTGIYLENLAGSGGVSIINAGAKYTGSYGISIVSKGAVAIKNVSTYLTGLQGIYVDNSSAVTAQPVTLTDINVEYAHGNGVEIYSKGTVTLNGVNSYNHSGRSLPQYQSVDLTADAYTGTWFNFPGQIGASISIMLSYSGSANIRLVDTTTGANLLDANATSTYSSGAIMLPSTGMYYLFVTWNWQGDPTYTLNFRYNTAVPYTVSGQHYSGIYINNTYGSGDVTIQGSSINPYPWVSENTGNGIDVNSKGNIKLLKTSLYRNQYNGATLVNSNAASAKAVTAGSLDILNSGQAGLHIYSIGAVTMSSINSSENAYSGIDVHNCILSSGKCIGSGAVSLTGTNHVNFNGDSGIYIYTIGMVTLNNIEAVGNFQAGLYITGPLNTELAVIPSGGGVTLNYTNNFRNSIGGSKHYSGVYIRTYGPVSLKNLEVYDNDWMGIDIRNQFAATNQPVTLTDVSVWNNGNIGINILSKGTVTLNGVSSTSNYYTNFSVNYGETIKALGAGPLFFDFVVPDAVNLTITFTSPEFQGNVILYDPDYNWLGSVYVSGGNPGSINAGTVSGGTYHLEAWNWSLGAFAYQLSISDPAGVLDSNYAISIMGIRIDNTAGTGNISLGKTTLSGNTLAAYNTGEGININTNGNLLVTYTTVTENYGNGLYITNNGQGKTNTLTDVTSSESGAYGVVITALGPVSWTKGLVMNNGWVTPASAVGIWNLGANSSAPVTLSKLRVYGSRSDGIDVYSKGAVSVTDSMVMDNASDGLYITTKGAISLTRTKIQFNHNPYGSLTYGAYLDNGGSTSLTPPGVTITDSDFSYNSYGLYVYSKGTVALYGVNVENNYDHGDWIGLGTTLSATLPGYNEIFVDDYGWIDGGDSVTWTFEVTDVDYDLALYLDIFMDGYGGIYDSDFNYIDIDFWDVNSIPHYILQPGEYHVMIYTYANDAGGVYNLGLNTDPGDFASGTSANGVGIETNGSVIVARSTARNNNNFTKNGWNGLGIWAAGSVNLSDLVANGNLYKGVNISAETTGKPVTINKLYMTDNYYQNLDIHSYGPVSWTTGLSSGSMFGTGVFTTLASSPQAIAISKVRFENATDGSGLDVEGSGGITLTSVAAWNNDQFGLYVDNSSGSGPVTVNNTAGQLIAANGFAGLYINSNGSVTLVNVGSTSNGGSGIFVDNTYSTAAVKPGVVVAYSLDRWVDYNGYRGIDILSNGSIRLTTTKTLYVDMNSDTGIYLNNATGGTSAGVVLGGGTPETSTSQIRITNHWGGYGLFLYSQGPVTLYNIYSANTYYDSILIGSEGSETSRPSSVTLTNIVTEFSNASGLPTDGVHIHAAGPVTITKIHAVGHYGDGLDIFSTAGLVTVKKALTKWNGSDDTRYGIMINAVGGVILDSIISNGNDHNLYINTLGGVTLLGTYYKNEFNHSYAGDSITIYAGTGGINLNRMDLIYNSGGTILETTGKLTIKNTLIQNNQYSVSAVAGNGAEFNKVFSFSNGLFDVDHDGAFEVFNTDGIKLTLNGGAVSFTDSAFVGNTGSGIEIKFYAAPPYPLTFLRTIYFGNDSDYTGDANLKTYHL